MNARIGIDAKFRWSNDDDDDDDDGVFHYDDIRARVSH